jgi:hypothetical protein
MTYALGRPEVDVSRARYPSLPQQLRLSVVPHAVKEEVPLRKADMFDVLGCLGPLCTGPVYR